MYTRGMGQASSLPSPSLGTPSPVDCATQQAALIAMKAEWISKGLPWNYPAGQGPYGPLPPCVTTGGSGSLSNVADTMAGPFDITQIEGGNFTSATTTTSLMILAAIEIGLFLVSR